MTIGYNTTDYFATIGFHESLMVRSVIWMGGQIQGKRKMR